VTLPGREHASGRIHPLMRVRQEVEDIFSRMGYEILEGPEVEDDFHNFEALNMPPDHPRATCRTRSTWARRSSAAPGARTGPGRDGSVPDAQVRAATLLRTHTSAMQIRYMKTFPPPVRILVPGRVYRRDNLDLTHTPMFQQCEGLVVGEGVSLADLKGTFERCSRASSATSRCACARASSPTPSRAPRSTSRARRVAAAAAASASTPAGWRFSAAAWCTPPSSRRSATTRQGDGFAFGMGMERVAMLKYGVDDIRLFYENDLRFLEQFPV
jgi:phenylalanyl-tRNA synthetase alpha chain